MPGSQDDSDHASAETEDLEDNAEYPYSDGTKILLTTQDGTAYRVKIVKTISRNDSCILIVETLTSSDLYVLKLYDRRFAQGLRDRQNADDWSERIELDYRIHLHSDLHMDLSQKWTVGRRQDLWYEDEEFELWDDDTIEAYMQSDCLNRYQTEARAYETLNDIQGISIPRLHAKVYLTTQTRPGKKPGPALDPYLDCPGLLLQYIPGFPLSHLAENISAEHWQYTCDKAIEIAHSCEDRGVINRGAGTYTFLVTQDSTDMRPRVFMISFNISNFRDQAADERQYRGWQAEVDASGAVGFIMAHKLKGVYKYERSEREELLDREFNYDSTW